MNTTQKGDQFENICHEIISRALEDGRLGIIPSNSQLFRKQPYFSRDRESNIIFDLSIEVWLPGAERYSLLYLIECKNYSGKVPVSDVEEFHQKVVQVSGVNVKGVFITNLGFQEGAYTFARSKGMMLIEVNSNITYNIILHKANRHIERQFERNFTENYEPFIREIEQRKLIRNIDKLLIQRFVHFVKHTDDSPVAPSIKKLSVSEIEEIVNQLIDSFDPTILPEGKAVHLNDFLGFLKEVYSLEVIPYSFNDQDERKRSIIASCSFAEKCIRIDRSIIDTRRFYFAAAHEIGHYFLHNKIQISQSAYEKLDDSHYNFALDKHILENERNWIEWQANQFASSLLMPKKSILYRMFLQQDTIGLRPGNPLYVDEQRCNQDDFHSVTAKLASYFGTTKTSIIYRLNSLNMINFNYRTKTIGQILREMMNSFDFS